MTDSEISVDVTVSGVETDETQQNVVDTYERTIETFIRKNIDYDSSFSDSAKVESILKHGEVRQDELPDIVARQIFVRGMLDKVSRFYQLQFMSDDQMVDDEDVTDTLLDLGNYAIMLSAELQRLQNEKDGVAVQFGIGEDFEWSEEDVEEFMEEYDGSNGE